MPVDGVRSLSVDADLPHLRPESGDVLELTGVEMLHVFTEAPGDAAISALPPALHVTIPGCLYVTFLRVPNSPWGAFQLAEVRVGARLREKPRSLLVGAAVDNPAAAATLSSRFGYRFLRGEIMLRRYYDGVTGTVISDGRRVIDVGLRDPEPVPGATLQYAPQANCARTDDGPRVALVDTAVTFGDEQDRGRPEVRVFDGGWLGHPALSPTLGIGAFYAVVGLSLGALTLLDPEVSSGLGVVG